MTNVLHHPRIGYHLLRLSVAAMMLLHGIAKLMNGIDGIERMVVGKGLPAFVAYGVFIGEVLAPLLVLAGVWVGPAALLMAVNMVFAIGLAHTHEVLTLGKQGGWAIELQGLFFVSSLAIALMAPPFGRKG
ncbi:DoxX family protein [Piscinibacter sp.]|uniref:DoxX family protein n=1 Tax=Piscinibacter sp. TaxID=1903157 RepID=UPI002C763FD9|nr:DoxX family protein [Albitalea sp.]HUG22354.1 DoxX family protein [Albitalea sp.]